MKIMKKYINGFFLLLAGVALFTACKDEDGFTKAEWNATEDYANISFVESSTTIEIDPTDPTSYTLHMSRRNTKGAVTVPIQITQGDDKVFSVTDAVFADGDSIVAFQLNYPNAEIGTTYKVQLGVTDPKFVSYYSDAVFTEFTVTRVKWNSLGMCTYVDNWFPVEAQVEIFQNESQPNLYRITKPYASYPGDDVLTMKPEEMDDYLTLTVRKAGETFQTISFTRNDIVTFPDYSTGAFHNNYSDIICLVHPYRFTSYRSQDGVSYNRITGYKEDGSIGQIQLAPYYYMFSVGGWNYSQRDGVITITFPGYVAEEPAYEAVFDPDYDDEDDFDWNDVKTFDFTNTLTGASRNVMLQKAVCNTNTDDCDKVFEETYGTPYRIKDDYVEGYDLIFFLKGKKIYVPEDIWYTYQPTGVTEEGLTATDIYAYIDSEGSSMEFTEDGDVNGVTLNVTFTDKKGQTSFGSGAQTLANVTWTEIATGTYYYVMFSENEDGSPEPDPGYKLYKRDDKNDVFKIGDWLMGTDFVFTWNQTTNDCVVLEQEIGYEHPNYGMMSIIEGALYHSNYAENTSYYDPENKVFHFFPAYVVAAGSFGQVEEFFEITEEAAVKRQVPFQFNARSLKAGMRRAPRTWLQAQKLTFPLGSKFSKKLDKATLVD